MAGQKQKHLVSCYLHKQSGCRWRDCVPNSSSASSEIITWDEKRDYLALQPAPLPYLPTITSTAPRALGRAALDSRGQPPYGEKQDRRQDSSWSQKKGFRRWYLCLCRVKWYLLHFRSPSKPPTPPPLLLLCCDHIAALGDKKAFSSVTELFYYLKCYLNLTIKYVCEFIPDCRS